MGQILNILPKGITDYILCPILYCQNNHNTYFGQLFEDCTYNKPPGENQRLSLYCGINGTWWLML